MTININNNPAFKGAAHAGAAATKAAHKALSALSTEKEITSKTLSAILRFADNHVSSPEQRLIMGVTALFSQPFIDLNNKRVNEETRLMSFSRTLAKIVVGTTVGFSVRKGAIKFAKDYIVKKMPEHQKNLNDLICQNQANTIGSVLGIVVSLFTNFLIDAPLTQIMTNYCYRKLQNDPDKLKTGQNNLLVKALNRSKPKPINFGNSKVIKAQNLKFLTKIKNWLFDKYVTDPGKMLIHTAAVGWGASSAAQIAGIALNNKIDANKKKFLIPQEFADAAANITLYYLITMSVKNKVENLFESGKIRFKPVMDAIRKEGQEKKLSIEKLFGNPNASVSQQLKELPTAKALYTSHKNGAIICATLIASVISGNVLTPFLRNLYAAHCQEKIKKRTTKANAVIFNLNTHLDKLRVKGEQNKSFKNFIV